MFDPVSLHRYLYVGANPVNAIDPSGECTLVSVSVTLSIQTNLIKSYTGHMFAIFTRSMRVLFCIIQPAAIQRDIAMMAIGGGAGPWAFTMYDNAMEQIITGLNKIQKIIKEEMDGFVDDIVPKIEFEFEFIDDELAELVELREAANKPFEQLEEFQEEVQKWADELQAFWGAPSEACKAAILMDTVGRELFNKFLDAF